mmetsp:Transcript_8080/g.49922  ORF Transcript_8080/g.49922 Transcript_8080/m.49922 type:complete len:307 (+) Transcript_8080:2558-3478(+)
MRKQRDERGGSGTQQDEEKEGEERDRRGNGTRKEEERREREAKERRRQTEERGRQEEKQREEPAEDNQRDQRKQRERIPGRIRPTALVRRRGRHRTRETRRKTRRRDAGDATHPKRRSKKNAERKGASDENGRSQERSRERRRQRLRRVLRNLPTARIGSRCQLKRCARGKAHHASQRENSAGQRIAVHRQWKEVWPGGTKWKREIHPSAHDCTAPSPCPRIHRRVAGRTGGGWRRSHRHRGSGGCRRRADEAQGRREGIERKAGIVEPGGCGGYCHCSRRGCRRRGQPTAERNIREDAGARELYS